MKLNSLIVLVFATNMMLANSYSQSRMPQQVTDSLWNIWNDPTQPDTLKLRAIHKIAWDGYLFSQPDSAFYFAKIEYDFAKKSELNYYMAEALNTMGSSFWIRADYNNALIYFKKSLDIHEKLNNKRSIASVLGNIGSINLAMGDFPAAMEYYLKTLNIFEELNHKMGASMAFNNIGLIYYYQNDFNNAILYFEKSLKIKEQLKDKKGIANTLGNFGLAYGGLQEFEKAIEYHHKCMEMQEELGDNFGIANTLDNIGIVYGMQADFPKAEEYFMKSIELKENIGDKKGISHSLNNIGNNHTLQHNYQEALNISKQSLIIAQELGIPRLLKDASRVQYQNYLKTGLVDSAYFNLKRLKSINENDLKTNYFSLPEKEKELYFANIELDFARYFDFTVLYNHKYKELADTAYNISLTNKGLLLKSSTAMRQAIIRSSDPLLIQEYDNWLELRKKISRLYEAGQSTKEIELEANNLEKELVKKSTVFSDFEKTKNIDWKHVRDGLKKGEAAIEFIHYTSESDSLNIVRYAALLIKKKSINPTVIPLCTEDDLVEILGKIQDNDINFVKSVYGSKEEAQLALYEKVWKPIDKHLKGIKKIYYSPSGLLHKVSFVAINKGPDTYLCDVYHLNQQSSTGILATSSNIIFDSDDSYVIFGGVTYNTANTTNEFWSYLPGTETETQNIYKYLKENNQQAEYFTNNNANEDNLKNNVMQANVLHISTHGFFFPDPAQVQAEQKNQIIEKGEVAFRGTTNYANWSFVNNKNPLMRSGLVLAGANDVWDRDPLSEGEDGILTANEVALLNLPYAKLVVLSACETGLGDIKGSEGVYGLQRAFKMAGVKNIIMSLWQVPDKETVEFMDLFYNKLITKKDARIAFNETQQEMRRKYDPFFWAAFVLIE